MSRNATSKFPFSTSEWATTISSGEILPIFTESVVTSPATKQKEASDHKMSEPEKILTNSLSYWNLNQEKTGNFGLFCCNGKQNQTEVNEIKRSEETKALSFDNSLSNKSNYDNGKTAFQAITPSARNSNSPSTPKNQLPTWSNLAALSGNQHLLAANSSNPSGFYRIKTKALPFAAVNPILGNLLPPPPSLPATTTSMELQSGFPTKSPSSSASRSCLLKSHSNDIDLHHTSAATRQAANLTSSADRNQPLDLSTTKRQPQSDTNPGDGLSAHGVERPSTSISVDRTNPNIGISCNKILPQATSVAQNSGPSTESTIIQKRAGSHLQSDDLSVVQDNQKGKRDLSFLTDFNREYIQKWMYAAQQQQLKLAAQQLSSPQQKRPKSVRNKSKSNVFLNAKSAP